MTINGRQLLSLIPSFCKVVLLLRLVCRSISKGKTKFPPLTNVVLCYSGRHSRRPEAEPPPQQQMLFIQMEFCPRTLREVLDRGPLNPEDSWQVISSVCMQLMESFYSVADSFSGSYA